MIDAYLSITRGGQFSEEDGSPRTTRIKAIKVGLGDVGGVSGKKSNRREDCPMFKNYRKNRYGFGISSENIIITKCEVR